MRSGPAVDRAHVLAPEFEALHDRRERHGVSRARGFDQERGDDRQGERQLDRELGSDTGHALDLDQTVQTLDRLQHDVQPDATARDFGDRFRGRKAGGEDELQQLALAQHVIGLDQPALDGLRARLGLDAGTVVRS
jgi:hypothetical protein